MSVQRELDIRCDAKNQRDGHTVGLGECTSVAAILEYASQTCSSLAGVEFDYTLHGDAGLSEQELLETQLAELTGLILKHPSLHSHVETEFLSGITQTVVNVIVETSPFLDFGSNGRKKSGGECFCPKDFPGNIITIIATTLWRHLGFLTCDVIPGSMNNHLRNKKRVSPVSITCSSPSPAPPPASFAMAQRSIAEERNPGSDGCGPYRCETWPMSG